ncbi:MAG TPA: hypothetical protein VGI74_15670 [Streptosporangiaceae bacterium]
MRRPVLAEALVIVWLGMPAPAEVAIVAAALGHDWIIWRLIAWRRAVVRAWRPGAGGSRVAIWFHEIIMAGVPGGGKSLQHKARWPDQFCLPSWVFVPRTRPLVRTGVLSR